MMELEFTIRTELAESYVAVATGAAQRGSVGNQGADPLSAHSVRHPRGVAQEGGTAVGGCGAVPADAVSADFRTGHAGRIQPDARISEDADLPFTGQSRKASGIPATTGWESEREILFGLIQEALRQPAGTAKHQKRTGTDLPQMGAHHGGGVGGIFDAGLRAVSAFGRMTEDTEEDEEERRRRIQAEENSRAAGTVLGLAIGALLAIREEEERCAEAALQEEYENEQQSIWQLSM